MLFKLLALNIATVSFAVALLPGEPVSDRTKLKPPEAVKDAVLDAELELTLRKFGYRIQSNVIIQWKGMVPTLFGGHKGVRHAARRVMDDTRVPALKDKLAELLKGVEE